MLKSSSLCLKLSKHILRSRSYSKQMSYKMEPRYDYNRRWTQIGDEEAKPLNSFKLISYNILAQDLLLEHLNLYVNIQQYWLTWRQRLQNLQREILKLEPDILCLQEMQFDHLPMLVQRLTACSGKRLEYIYKKKTGSRTDGCAIIYDASKFKLLAQQGVELFEANVPLLNRENVALLAKFRLTEPKESAREVIIATTHLLYNPKRDDVRCAQITKLLTKLHSFAAYTATEGDQAPIVLTGDFNSEEHSPPMALVTAKSTDDSSICFEPIDPGEHTASTYQDRWVTVDYILRSTCTQSKHQLQPISVYNLPVINCCANVGSIPNHYLGSDHYALGAVFGFVENSNFGLNKLS